MPWVEVSWKTAPRRQHVTCHCCLLTHLAAQGGQCPRRQLLRTSFCMEGTDLAHSWGATHICGKNNRLMAGRVCCEGRKRAGAAPGGCALAALSSISSIFRGTKFSLTPPPLNPAPLLISREAPVQAQDTPRVPEGKSRDCPLQLSHLRHQVGAAPLDASCPFLGVLEIQKAPQAPSTDKLLLTPPHPSLLTPHHAGSLDL